MASANHLLMVFLAVEMASVPSYALAGMLKGRRLASEAALKYSVYGAGAAGVMIGLSFHAISPFIGLTFALKGLVVMLLGGLGNVAGAMIGGLILGLAEVLSIVILPTEINLQDIFSFGIMILILIFKPTGLFGTRIKQG